MEMERNDLEIRTWGTELTTWVSCVHTCTYMYYHALDFIFFISSKKTVLVKE